MDLKLVSTIDPERMLATPGDIIIDVGYFNEEHHSGLTDADIAEYLSDGDSTIGMPPRPHLLEGLSSGEADIKASFDMLAERVVARKLTGSDLMVVGNKAVDSVRHYILSGALAPNAPSRIAEKGSDQPLVETGELLRLLTFEVERGLHG